MRAPITLLVAAAALAVPATAGAAADATLSKDTPTFAWEGGPGSGHAVSTPEGSIGTYYFGCGAPVPHFFDCDATLLEVKEKGDLKVAIDAAGDLSDLDLYLYKSDAEGEYDPLEDEPVASQADGETDETVTVKAIEPGFYVAHVEYWEAKAETYDGTAEMSGFPVPATAIPVAQTPPPPPVQTQAAPPPPPPAQPAPAAAKKPSKRAACMKKAKKIKKAKARKRAVKKCKRLKG